MAQNTGAFGEIVGLCIARPYPYIIVSCIAAGSRLRAAAKLSTTAMVLAFSILTNTIKSVVRSITQDYIYVSTAAYGGTIFWKHNPAYMKATGAKEYK
jgi:hypothetical protein